MELRGIERLARAPASGDAGRAARSSPMACASFLRQSRIVLGLAHDDIEQPAKGLVYRGFAHSAATATG